MENNFYVGVVYHSKKLFKNEYKEKLVLYSEDGVNYLDLLTGIWYTIDANNKDYVIRESIISTDVKDYKTDYMYLVLKYKEGSYIRRKSMY